MDFEYVHLETSAVTQKKENSESTLSNKKKKIRRNSLVSTFCYFVFDRLQMQAFALKQISRQMNGKRDFGFDMKSSLYGRNSAENRQLLYGAS
ncbi:CLUMA_CG019220, isoform A [Clunio marinus]|uniref:CLUMA_CG019220, isoform A n=1 Tax=Clunio marinus TaxID=568069 RepID=A0A1J1J5F9_9DIPT|nr:CLUMA_CG019220, isoform A [Clunio marinus]